MIIEDVVVLREAADDLEAGRVFYDIEDEVAYVIAILPLRRDPVWLEKKVRGRTA